jgi:hypothetical protein
MVCYNMSINKEVTNMRKIVGVVVDYNDRIYRVLESYELADEVANEMNAQVNDHGDEDQWVEGFFAQTREEDDEEVVDFLNGVKAMLGLE